MTRHADWDVACKIYIGGLLDTAERFDLEEAFGKFGRVKNSWVARRPPGFGFIEMEDPRDAEDAARELNGTKIAGARVRVEMSRPNSRRGGGDRGGGGGRGRYNRSRSRDRKRSRSRSREYRRPRRSPSYRSMERRRSPSYDRRDDRRDNSRPRNGDRDGSRDRDRDGSGSKGRGGKDGSRGRGGTRDKSRSRSRSQCLALASEKARFSPLLKPSDKEFLKYFRATSTMNPGASTTRPSRLAPPGSVSKRTRPESVDLETGLEAKKLRMGAPEKSSAVLARSKSKSTMNLASSRPGKSLFTSIHLSANCFHIFNGQRRTTLTGPSSSRPGIAGRTTGTVRQGVDRRATTASALNKDRPGLTRERTTLGTLNREKSTLNRSTMGGNGGAGGKRPAWDLKGRLEDMEGKFVQTMERLAELEKEKENLQTDNEVKLEVVTQTTKEVGDLRKNLELSEEEVKRLKKKITEMEDEHSSEVNRLKRQLENEEFNKASLERKLKALEDELTSKQTEISGLKNSVAELTSSRSGLEASLGTTQIELEGAKNRITALTTETTEQKAEIERMREKINWEETQRRKLHNMVQELKGNIRVFCRVRPLLGDEIEKYGSIKHITINAENALELVKTTECEAVAGGLNKNMKYDFEFDRVFGQTASQASVFEEISQLVQSALDGYNVCVFAYGQTGSGKTFTMEGGDILDEEMAGMIPRTIRQIFNETERLKDRGWDYTLQASFLEIYNEEIRDLLATEKNLKYDIKMCDSKGSDVYVTNLKIEPVTTEAEISSMLKRARKHRAVAETQCNERSSRSHSVFMLRISGLNKLTTETCSGTLNLVDLAGSERIKESGSEGQRLTEAQAINKSLSNLGNVIMALAQKNSHVPYRNSKLTHLLQNSLGGNSKTLMFVNLNPREDSFNETLNSLRFATKVNQCHIGTAVKKIK